jgi:hypothetical protein
MDLYIHSPIRLHGAVLNYISTGTTLPSLFTVNYRGNKGRGDQNLRLDAVKTQEQSHVGHRYVDERIILKDTRVGCRLG